MLGILLLALSAALMAVAVLRRLDGTLFAAVMAYAGTVVYIIEVEPWLLPPALLVALAIGVTAIVRIVLGRPRLADDRAEAASVPDGG